ncbi:probable RNA polymerase II nuclear localization protein SLC7A6OS [Pseudomyrmex gracilis]|uniref:probable RNA polymerase II nuclear localization protein SLC7A6OS n=1 Tax=Pseudomyrmex gracilis TaxID=219809 RepID=UPI0009959432|nr:probable RNA polymerase II nuclear localization protein SLC7A6OS [Pseudomyrmex gracilis]XP_020297276.1 probable RNA polymerase II nuclear localization protein SLC7A6OS [Pseudomyrmex gracilis]
MSAVLRVKRKATSLPEEKLLVSAIKRQKAESSSDESETTVDQTILHFAGTVKDQIEDVTKYVAKVLPKQEKVRSCNKRTLSHDDNIFVSGKISRLIESDSITERFKVINRQRSVEISESSDKKWVTLIDIEDSWNISEKDEKEKTLNDDTVEKKDNVEEKEQVKEDMEEYVYDLYCAQTCSHVWYESDKIMVQHCVDLVPEQDSDEDKSTTDSNSESHWKNDYPDDSDSNSSDANNTPKYYSSVDSSESEQDDLDKCTAMLRKLKPQKSTSESVDEGNSSDDSNKSFGIM